jgi:hypothetical protein
MHKPDHVSQGWRALGGLLRRVARPAPRWLPATTVLALAMGLGIPIQSAVVQAQDGGSDAGQQATADYELIVDTGDLSADKMCLGSTASFPTKVQRTVRVAGDTRAGRIELRHSNLNADTDLSILSQSSDSASTGTLGVDVPFQTTFLFTGKAVGNTSIVFTASVTTNEGTYNRRQVVPVRVVPCDLRLDSISVWHTTMYNANVFITANVINGHLTSNTGQTFEGEALVQMNFAVNRIRGCLLDHTGDRSQRVTMRGEIIDDHINISVRFPEYEASNTYIRCIRPIPTQRIQSCEDYPDGVCDPQLRLDRFSPEPLNFSVPLGGGSDTVDQKLNHSQGTAEGRGTGVVRPEAR